VAQPTPDAVRQQIARSETDPVYLIAGDDEHEKSALALAFGEMVEEGLRAFNVERLYATDRAVTALLVTEAARTLPMMALRRVVIVLSAEEMLAPKKKGRGAEPEADEEAAGDLEPLLDYLQNPSPTTSLVFVFSAADGAPDAIPLAKNLRITKALAKAGTLVLCTGLDGSSDLSRWVVERAKAAGLEIDRQAVAKLLELASRDPGRIRADVEKLLLFAARAGRITVDHVAAMAGTPVHHGDDWALVRALEASNVVAALRELQATMDNGGIPYQILGQIGYAIRTPPPRGRFPTRRVPAAVEALFRTDVAMKSSGGDPRILLERLIVELCG
jgi:DNA polymerase-3 subunit delta